jgi:hypothetical protein
MGREQTGDGSGAQHYLAVHIYRLLLLVPALLHDLIRQGVGWANVVLRPCFSI